jgi:hypothetical protein
MDNPYDDYDPRPVEPEKFETSQEFNLTIRIKTDGYIGRDDDLSESGDVEEMIDEKFNRWAKYALPQELEILKKEFILGLKNTHSCLDFDEVEVREVSE